MTARWRSARTQHASAPLKMTAEVAGTIRAAARLVGAVSLVIFGTLAWSRGTPRSLENEGWEVWAQIGLVAVLALAYLVAWKWEGAGAAGLLIAGVALGVVASIAYHPAVALFAALAFVVPGIGFATHWQWHAGPWRLGIVAVMVPAVLVAGGWASLSVYDAYYGPTHPSSSTRLPDEDLVEWAWAGSVTSDGFVVKASLSNAAAIGARLRVGIEPGTDFRAFDGRLAPGGEGKVWEFTASGLDPGTTYWYAVEAGGHDDVGRRGTIRTFVEGPLSFRVAVGSCMRTGSDGAVFDRIREADPLLFIIPGDFTYENLSTTDPHDFLSAYARNLQTDVQQALYLRVPVVYTWDDHDFGGNDSDAGSVSRDAARRAYDAYVPHYPLPAGGGGAIYQAFTVGRVRFIVTDSRSERFPAPEAGAAPTMLGAEQLAWLKQEFLAANGVFPLIVWVNGVPWIAEESAGADNWGGFAREREEIANFIAENDIRGLAMLSGDAHMVAIDDGSNSDYATNGGSAAFPVLHAAALDRPGSVKGGPYSEGAYPGGGQFATMDVRDDGAAGITVTWTGMTYEGSELVRYEFTVGGELGARGR